MMTGNSYKAKIAVVSDIHLGNRRTTTAEIIANLEKAFPDDAETAQLDILFLAGDVFDDCLSLSDTEVLEIDIWIGRLLRVCKKHDIMVRVLEGTPSHDWKQSRRFTVINDVGHIGVDLRYVADLSIEYIEKYDLNVLYVPDEWNNDTDVTLAEVKELMRGKGLDHVDLGIMHGHFDYQVPPVIKSPRHRSDEYEKIVTSAIFIGHDHTPSNQGIIHATGSFDRLKHGQEHPKGHRRAIIHHTGPASVVFVENTTAKQYVTLDCTGLGVEDIITKTDEAAKALRDGANVRIEAESTNPIFENMAVLIRRYPLFNWSTLPRAPEEEESIKIPESELVVPYEPFNITPDNIHSLLMTRVANAQVSAEILECSDGLLRGVI